VDALQELATFSLSVAAGQSFLLIVVSQHSQRQTFVSHSRFVIFIDWSINNERKHATFYNFFWYMLQNISLLKEQGAIL
jgi:hypothetical protein